MAIIAKDSGRTFVPAPEGTHPAVCVDVVDLGVQMTGFGAKHQIQVVWEIDEEHPEFEGRYTVSQRYTLSLNEKAKLSIHLESWRGKKFTSADRDGFDVEKLIGAPCLINVVHNDDKQGRTWANVGSIMPMPKNMEKLIPTGKYVREINREKSRDVNSTNYVSPDAWSNEQGDGAEKPARPDVGDDPFGNDDDLPF